MSSHLKIEKKVTKRPVKRSKYDSAWKKVIQELFEDFLAFLFPEIHKIIDFSKKPTFLDKELLDITQDSFLGDRVADILARVFLKEEYGGGGPQRIRIITHIEVQGKGLSVFMERMFIYFYRAYDREKKKNNRIISLAILTDDDPSFRPTEYGYQLGGFKLLMEIPIVKLLDYKYNPALIAKLETSDNPIALVVKSQLKSLELKGADNERKFEALKELIRLCYQKRYSREYTRIVLRFFELTIRLPEVYTKSIKQVIIKTEEEFKMEYIPSWERDAVKIGEKKGIMKVALKMLKKGLDIAKVADFTGLNKEEIEKLHAMSH